MRVVILGAGFGGLELAAMLSEAVADRVDVVLIDENDAFVFGYSKLDVLFGWTTPEAVRLPYREISKQGVRFLQDSITAVDPEARRVTTNAGVHEADVLVIALGADYDLDATPGLAEANEFYSVAGAERLAEVLPTFSSGRAIVGACGAPFKCPPAPSETALMLHDYLSARGVRETCEIALVLPFDTPVPPSPDTSEALLAAFAERGIEFVRGRCVASLDRNLATLDDGREMPFDLFLGVPKHRAPAVLGESGLADDGFVPVSPETLETRFPGVGRSFRRDRRSSRRLLADRDASGRRAAWPVRRARLLLYRVRRRSRRSSRYRLPLGAEAHRHVQRAVDCARGREARVRLEPARPLVRALSYSWP